MAINISEEIIGYLKNSEANIVASLFADPQSFATFDYLEDKIYHNTWKVFYVIGRDMVMVEDKVSLDEVSVAFYLEKHEKLKEAYIKYGGYNTINALIKVAKKENLDGYIEEHQKYMAMLELKKNGMVITPDLLSKFKDLKAEDIYGYYETIINNIFVNIQSKITSYNLLDDLPELIETADKGLEQGMPISNSVILNDITGGNRIGNITLLGANSGVGKTTLSLIWILESVIKLDEKMVIMINEEDEVKWRKELLTYYANNKFGGNFQKKRWREGGFTEAERELLYKSANYLKELKSRKNLTIIPLPKYRTDLAVKIIRKYKGLGVSYFILDTFKSDADDDSDVKWSRMADAMVKLYDTVKPVAKNVHLWVTLQLSKGSIQQRYLTQNNIGQAKNVIDVASTCLLVRYAMQEEKSGGRNELNVYRLEGKTMQTRIPVTLDKDKNYMIIFLDKNRFGEARTNQIVAEVDWSTNKYKEIGITRVPEDY